MARRMPPDLNGFDRAANDLCAWNEVGDLRLDGCNQCGVLLEPHALRGFRSHAGEVFPLGLRHMDGGVGKAQRALRIDEATHVIAMDMRDEDVRDTFWIDARFRERRCEFARARPEVRT